MKIKIAIADDHPLMIDGIKTALSDTPEIEIIGEASNGLEIIEVVKTKKPDLVLLDIRMPELDSIDAAKILKKQYEELKIIMLTQYGDRRFIKHCQEIGVDGYLLKDCGKQELEKAIKIVYNGGLYFIIGNNLNDYFNTGINDPKSLITPRELEVLELFSKDFTSEQAAEKLGIKTSSIKTFRQRLLSKTSTLTLSGLISWAYQNNIL